MTTEEIAALAANDVIALAAETLHHCGGPGAGALLRDEHGCDSHGRCRGCPHAGTVAPLFPCRLRRIGEAAARLDEKAETQQGTEWSVEDESRGLSAGDAGSGPVSVCVV